MRRLIRWTAAGALLSAVAFLLGARLPVAGLVLSFWASVPLLGVGLGCGWIAQLASSGLGIALVAALGGPLYAGLYTAVPGTLAAALAFMARRGRPAARSVATGAVCMLAALIVAYGLLARAVAGEATHAASAPVSMGPGGYIRLAFAEQAGRVQHLTDSQREALAEGAEFFAQNFIGLTGIILLFGALLAYLLAASALPRLGLVVPPLPRLSGYRLPEHLVLGLIVGGALYLGGRWIVAHPIVAHPSGWDSSGSQAEAWATAWATAWAGAAALIGQNLAIFCFALYFLGGVGVMQSGCERFGAGPLLVMLTYLVAIWRPELPTALGIADVWVNFRTRSWFQDASAGNGRRTS